MSNPPLPFPIEPEVGLTVPGLLRVRTLVLLRWLACFGQIGAAILASAWLGMQLPMGWVILTVSTSAALNLVLRLTTPASQRLTDQQAMLLLLFDLTQLSVLLLMTGGLNNPFALLATAPVVISATALGLMRTVFLGCMAMLQLTLLYGLTQPLHFQDGSTVSVSPLQLFGFWLALMVGVFFLGLYALRVSTETRALQRALLATQVALAREQRLTALGGVVAAAAHELGTPLATIKLVASELIEELSDQPELQEDAILLRAQADRCRDILRAMGRAGKDDLQLHRAPLSEILREAAEPHLERGKQVEMHFAPTLDGDPREPEITRQPEIIHGLRNLIQNAVDFAQSSVWIEGEWSANTLYLSITDDGPGFPPQMLGRIGDPFVSVRRKERPERPGYEGMGLGLFIAKTLLERSGAQITFANASDPFLNDDERPTRCGAVIKVRWALPKDAYAPRGALGENRLNQA